MHTQEIEGNTRGEKYKTEFSYCLSDPIAVKVVFPGRVGWLFARDLLTEALDEGCSGEGDVRFTVTNEGVYMSIMGLTIIEFPRTDVEAFYCVTLDMVDVGDEVVDLAADFQNWFGATA